MTPVGVGWGLIEAARFHWWLAVLMGALLGVISLFVWSVVRKIRQERASP
jgi:membrane-associated phospholipid phosphatase